MHINVVENPIIPQFDTITLDKYLTNDKYIFINNNIKVDID